MRHALLKTALAWLLRASAWVGWLALGLMMVVGAADVMGTAFFSRPLGGAFEMAEAGLAVVMFLGLIHSQVTREHIVVDLVSGRLRGTARRIADCVSLLGMTLAIGLIARQTWPLMLDSIRIREVAGGAFNFPIYPIKVLVCVGATAAALVAVGQLVQAITRLRAGSRGEGE